VEVLAVEEVVVRLRCRRFDVVSDHVGAAAGEHRRPVPGSRADLDDWAVLGDDIEHLRDRCVMTFG